MFEIDLIKLQELYITMLYKYAIRISFTKARFRALVEGSRASSVQWNKNIVPTLKKYFVSKVILIFGMVFLRMISQSKCY